jgi:hypothetical protein
MAKHPDRLHRIGDIHELNRTVALDERLRSHHFERDSAQSAHDRGIVLPISLPRIGMGTNETAVVLLHNQDTPGPVEERLLEHRGS